MNSNRTTVPALLATQAETRPGQLFVSCGTDHRTYGEMQQIASTVASSFAAFGISPEDRVALMLPNRIEMLECFFALATLGAVQVPINIYLKGEFLRWQLANSKAGTVIVDRPGLAAIEPLLPELPSIGQIILIDDDASGLSDRLPCHSYSDLRRGTGATLTPMVVSRPDQPLSIMYTSGTTGLPKGCLCPHGYYVQTGLGYGDFVDTRDGDVLFTALPLYHMGGQGNALMWALTQGTTVIFEPEFSARSFMPRATALGATVLFGPGVMAVAILATPPAPDEKAHDVRLAIFGPLLPDHQLAFEARFGVTVNGELFGQSECTPIAYNPTASPRARNRQGRAAPWLEIRVVDDDDVEVTNGTVGEICVRSKIPDAMYQGYWNDPTASLQAVKNLWHHTGDLGTIDDQGFLQFVDRKKDALRRRGENVSSIELEAAIGRFPAVAEVAVHAVPSPVSEDDIKACLVLRGPEAVTPAELFKFFASELPYFAIPRYVEIMPELPKNPMGRVMKPELRRRGVTAETWDLETLGLVVERADRRT